MEVAENFNLKGHDYTKNLKFWIIKKNLSQMNERLTLHLLMQRQIPILNAIQPSIYKITNFNLSCKQESHFIKLNFSFIKLIKKERKNII